METITKAIRILDRMDSGEGKTKTILDSRALLIVTALFLVFMLSVKETYVDMILWYSLYPIIMAPITGLDYGKLFRQSLIVLPIVLLIGVFNPIFDRSTFFNIGTVSVSQGWLSFVGIVVRGLLAIQALFLLIDFIGFQGLVRGMERLRVPKFLTTQMMMIFRYLKVFLEEIDVMRNALESRSYGKRVLNLKMWSILIGRLLLRSYERAERINDAMVSRGFTGSLPSRGVNPETWKIKDTVFLLFWGSVFALFRFYNPALLFAY